MNGCLARDQTRNDLVNPFVHHLELTTTYEKIKAGILTVVVLPVRLLVIVCLLVMAWLLACVGLFGLSEQDLQERPISSWRRGIRWLVGLLLRTALFVIGFHWVKVRGTKASRHLAPVIAMAPHSSFFDILAIICMGDVSVVSKYENCHVSFIGKLINFTQPVYVWRDDPDSRKRTIQQIIDRATSVHDWSQLLIFPEGTTTNRSCLITFKTGAFNPGVPVQPVILRYPNKLDTVTWTWQGPGVFKLMWLTLVQPHSNCEIEFLPVYKPNEQEKQDAKLFADNVRKLMARALGVPTVDYTYDDCQVVDKANLLSIPSTCHILKIHKLRVRLGLTRSNREAKLVTERPEQMQSEQIVDYPEFTKRLAIQPADETSHTLFSLLEEEQKRRSQVDFSEYLLCVLMVERASSQEDMIEEAFQLCGVRDRLNCRQLSIVLRLVLQMSHSVASQLSQEMTASRQDISYDEFESFMKNRPEYCTNNNTGHEKAD